MGTAPDAFDGVHMKGDWLLSGSGAKNKPYLRDFVGGGTGVFTAAHGWMHIASGKFRTCLVVCEEKMSPCNPHPAGAFITIFDHTTEQALMPTLIHIFGIEMCRFMHVYGYTPEDLARVSVLCKGNALGHPAAQIAMETTVKEVLAAPVLSWPVKRMDISPTSDGAVALVFCNEDVARARSKAPAFIDGVGFRLDTAYWCSRDLAYPAYVAMAAADAYKMAGVTNPYDDIDFFEPYDPFNYKAMHHMNALLQDRSGRRAKDLLLSGQLERTGSHPMCPSGGLLGVGNPIAAAGLMKIAELYFQLTGQAGATDPETDPPRRRTSLGRPDAGGHRGRHVGRRLPTGEDNRLYRAQDRGPRWNPAQRRTRRGAHRVPARPALLLGQRSGAHHLPRRPRTGQVARMRYQIMIQLGSDERDFERIKFYDAIQRKAGKTQAIRAIIDKAMEEERGKNAKTNERA